MLSPQESPEKSPTSPRPKPTSDAGPVFTGTRNGSPCQLPDLASSTDDYARRFAGAGGRMLLEVQEKTVMSLAQVGPGCRVLDVGGGHGQLTEALLAAGCSVTILGSSDSSFARVRRLFGNRIECVAGDLSAPPFPDKSFEVVISLRILAHIRDEEPFLAGLCRVAERRVLVDYADVRSFNLLSHILFRVKLRLEGDTRTFRIFREPNLTGTFAHHGFGRTHAKPQFFWPVVVHRRLSCPWLSRVLEAPPRWLGLTRVLGSPVVLCAERNGKV